MAVLTCNFYSNSLGMETTFQAVIPDQCKEDIPTVYLLHGLSDDYTMWLRMTSAERYARQRGIALIIPCGARSFYTDMEYGPNYYTYISEELVGYTRKLFRLSGAREKTFVAGLSMGGYGAFKIALSKPEQYGAVAGFSGVVDIREFFQDSSRESDGRIIWGENYHESLKSGNNNLFSLAKELKESRKPTPRIYQACGTEDFLYNANQRFRQFIEPLGFDYRYAEGEGTHEWGFWDKCLPAALDFFLEKVK